MSTGYAILMDIEGNKIDFSNMPKGMKTPKLSNCKRITARSSQMIYAMKTNADDSIGGNAGIRGGTNILFPII